jgi:hypothetical protein
MTASDRLVRRRLLVLLPLAGAGLLAGCADEPPAPPTEFAPLSFDYLPKLRLNVTSIDIDNAWQPGTVPNATHIEALSPVQPVDALRQMAQERLLPTGTSGHAVFVIEDASLVQRAGQYEGTMQVHLDISTSDGTHSGYAKAFVTATRTIVEDSPAAARASLYELVKRMMQDMNAEFEFQVRKTLRDYLQSSVQTAPPATPVQMQDLNPAPPKP